jgi:hypothetical protein
MKSKECSNLKRSSALRSLVILCLALSPISYATLRPSQWESSQQSDYREKEVVYQYQPPVTFKHPDRIPLLVSESKALNRAEVEGKLTRLATALNVRFNFTEAKLTADKYAETSVYSDRMQRWKVYPRSGMIRYEDVQSYNVIPKDFATKQAPSEEKAMALARDIVERLDNARVINRSEILWDAPRVYYSKLQGSTGRPQRGKAEPELTAIYNTDTRVFLPRIKEGIPVSGDNLRLVFTPEGRLASLNLMWRDLKTGPQTYQRRLDMSQAREEFERSLNVPRGSRVEVSVNELTYFDPSPRDAVAFLEPVYLFVYTVKTPIKEKPGVFSISKKLSRVIPAVEHGQAKLPSIRKARLAELAKKFGNPAHPLRPVIPKRRTEGEYSVK